MSVQGLPRNAEFLAKISYIRLAGYSLTIAPVVRALVDAKKRGVDVAVAVDYKNNLLIVA